MRALWFSLALLAAPAQAAVYDEFEVHGTDIAPAGGWSLDQHFNYGLRGQRQGGFRGALTPNNGALATTEISRGVTNWWESALYLPQAVDPRGGWHVGGAKWRNLFVLHGQGEPSSFGVLTELRLLSRRFQPTTMGWEVRPIASHTAGRWTAVATLGFAGGLGPRAETALSPALRLDYAVSERLTLGAEHYADLGAINHPVGFNRQAHQSFAVAETEWHGATLVLGLGRGLTPASDRWVVKARVAVGF